jgi:hypothetical protein
MPLFNQMAVNSVVWWCLFSAIVYCVARYTRWWCIPIGYLTVVAIICVVDVSWVRHEISRPGWEGEPDMDKVFAIGMFARMVFTCAALLPVTVVGVLFKRRHLISDAHAIAF